MKFLRKYLDLGDSVSYRDSQLLRCRPSEGWDPVLILEKNLTSLKMPLSKANASNSGVNTKKTGDWIPAFAGTTNNDQSLLSTTTSMTKIILPLLLFLITFSSDVQASKERVPSDTWQVHTDAGAIPCEIGYDELDEMESAENSQDADEEQAAYPESSSVLNKKNFPSLSEEQKKNSC